MFSFPIRTIAELESFEEVNSNSAAPILRKAFKQIFLSICKQLKPPSESHPPPSPNPSAKLRKLKNITMKTSTARLRAFIAKMKQRETELYVPFLRPFRECSLTFCFQARKEGAGRRSCCKDGEAVGVKPGVSFHFSLYPMEQKLMRSSSGFCPSGTEQSPITIPDSPTTAPRHAGHAGKKGYATKSWSPRHHPYLRTPSPRKIRDTINPGSSCGSPFSPSSPSSMPSSCSPTTPASTSALQPDPRRLRNHPIYFYGTPAGLYDASPPAYLQSLPLQASLPAPSFALSQQPPHHITKPPTSSECDAFWTSPPVRREGERLRLPARNWRCSKPVFRDERGETPYASSSGVLAAWGRMEEMEEGGRGGMSRLST